MCEQDRCKQESREKGEKACGSAGAQSQARVQAEAGEDCSHFHFSQPNNQREGTQLQSVFSDPSLGL